MMGMKTRILIACAVFLGASESRSDVIVKYQSKADMANVVSLRIEGVESIKDEKCRSTMATNVDGGMMAMMGSGPAKGTISIVRLDKGLFWELDTDNKAYKESSLESLREQSSLGEGMVGEKPGEEYVWSLRFTPIQERQIINGFLCAGNHGEAVGIKKNGSGDTVFVTYEQWSSGIPSGGSEIRAYQTRYAVATGVNQMWAKECMSAMLKGYGPQFELLADSLNRSDEFPIKTIIAIESSAARTKGSDDSGATEQMPGRDIPDEAGRASAFSMVTEILSIKEAALDDSQFEIPQDFTKK